MENITCTHESQYVRYSDWHPNDRGVDYRWKWCHKCGEELAEQRRTSEGF